MSMTDIIDLLDDARSKLVAEMDTHCRQKALNSVEEAMFWIRKHNENRQDPGNQESASGQASTGD